MNVHSNAPLLVAPPPVAVAATAASASSASAAANGAASAAPAAPAAAAAAPVLSKKQLKQAATRERERERAALEAQREAAAAAAAVAAASSGGSAARSSGGGGSRSDRERDRPRHHKDEQSSNSSGGGGGGGGGGNTRKHERHASASSLAGGAAGSSSGAGPASTGGGGPTPRYTKGLPSQYPASSPTHAGAAANNSNAAPAAAAAAASSASSAKQPFLHPPSLFRYHSRKPVPFVMQPASVAPPLSSVPPFYAPTNLLRLIRSLSPKLTRDFTLGDLWDFYDLPYGHDIDVLLDPQQLLHGAAHAHTHTHTHPSSFHALHAQPEGTEVYYVPYLSALVLYERAQPGVDPAVAEAAPPLLQWFEHVSPYQRMPLPDSIASIASCFSPAPSSPLYELFRPFPSRTILRQLAAHQLDTRRSWYAITWYPILHDPLSTPFLPGSFLLYHGFEVEAEVDGAGPVPRCCPLQESTFRGVAELPVAVAPVANGTAAVAAVPVRARPPLSEVGSSDVDCGLTTAGEEEEEAGDDADGETEESEVENASSAPTSGSGLARRRQRRNGVGKKAVPPPFPPHLCPHCGDKHGPPVPAPALPALVQPVPALPAAAAPSPLGYLPLLGYMCHRVLPSTWYVQAFQPPPSAQQLHPHQLQQQQQHQQQSQQQQQQTATGTRNGADSIAAPGVQLKQQQQHLQQQQHQLECVSSFNAALHTPAAFTHLSLSQPARLTHADLSLALHEALQRTQHPDFLHMTTVTQTLK